MKNFILIWILVFNITLNASDKTQTSNVSINYGESSEDIDIYRLSLRKEFNKGSVFFPSYYETSVGYWEGDSGDSLSSISIIPMFRFTFDKYYDVNGYMDIGLGATYISETKLENENFGIHFQFENIFGVGFIYKDFEVGYRYIHYSNAGLSSHNNGVTFNAISISYKF